MLEVVRAVGRIQASLVREQVYVPSTSDAQAVTALAEEVRTAVAHLNSLAHSTPTPVGRARPARAPRRVVCADPWRRAACTSMSLLCSPGGVA